MVRLHGGIESQQSAREPRRFVRDILSTQGLLFLALMIIWIILSFATPYFFTATNMRNLMRQTAIIGIVSIGMTYVIIGAGIDLSVGSVVALSNVVTALLLVQGRTIFAILPIALLLAAMVGLTNGMVTFEGKVPDFIATLGMMGICRGVALLLSHGRNIAGLPREFTSIARESIGGIPILFIIFISIAIISQFILSCTRFGIHLYGAGGNREAAMLSGINLRLVKYSQYVISGLLAGMAGILLTTRLSMGMPTAGIGYELDAIAAVVIGGASLFGGEGNVMGTVIGALLVSTLYNGANLLGVDPFWQRIMIGVLIILTVLIDQVRKRG